MKGNVLLLIRLMGAGATMVYTQISISNSIYNNIIYNIIIDNKKDFLLPKFPVASGCGGRRR